MRGELDATGKGVWLTVDVAFVDWTAQFNALERIGYANAVNLETHWRDGGEGAASLLDHCGDEWNWLDTLRSVAGEKRCILLVWPEGRRHQQ